MIYERDDVLERTALQVAEKMVTAAVTAPKAHGLDNLTAKILTGKEKLRLAQEMRRIAKEDGVDFYARDAGNIEKSYCVVLLATKGQPLKFPKCVFCGRGCRNTFDEGGSCAFTVIDLGIAIGSAVSIAADNRVDNRVMYSAGDTAVKGGFFDEPMKACIGIPLFVSAKNVFFDRIRG